MGTASAVIGVIVFLTIGFDLATGRIRGRNGVILRSASPLLFWGVIAMKCLVPIILVFPQKCMSIIQFGIEDTSADTRRKVLEFHQKKRDNIAPVNEPPEQNQDNPG